MMSAAASHNKHMTRSEALGLWYEVTLDSVRGETPDLSARQMTILMTVYLRPAPHTVRSLAAHLDVTKAVITRALDTLGVHGFIDRARDPNDKRSVLVRRTGRGSSYLAQFADSIRQASKTHISKAPVSVPVNASVNAPVSTSAKRRALPRSALQSPDQASANLA